MENSELVIPVVYCIDTEGPLNETIQDTFSRLELIYGVKELPTLQNYEDLKNGNLSKKHKLDFSKVFNKTTLSYNRSMDDLDNMLSDACSAGFRDQYKDDFNHGWAYNWFCVAHYGFLENPRDKIEGVHTIFDKYVSILGDMDTVQFHYHPLAANLNASASGTTWLLGETNLLEILSKRIIERNWFPACNRPGFHVTRPDSHWFLEQYIPFDFASQSLLPNNPSAPFDYQLGDWRRAPVSWVPYNPSHEDWQVPGQCNRTIARCLNIGTRHSLINLDEIRLAFREKEQGKRPVLAFTNHDYRDIRKNIADVYKMLRSVQNEFPHIKFKYTKPEYAFHSHRDNLHISFEIDIKENSVDISTELETFGIQPFFCYETKNGVFRYDNLQINIPKHKWKYTFNGDTEFLENIRRIGVAANTKYGVTSVSVIDIETMTEKKTILNA